MAGAEQPRTGGRLLTLSVYLRIETQSRSSQVFLCLSVPPGAAACPRAARHLPNLGTAQALCVGLNARGSNTRAENAAPLCVWHWGIGVCADRGILANPI